MTAALIFVVWTVIAVAVGLVIGRVMRVGDEIEAKRRAHEAEVARLIRNKIRGVS